MRPAHFLHSVMIPPKSRPLFYPTILSLLFLLVVGPLSVEGNECVVDGTYLKLDLLGTSTIVQEPESGQLQDVGDKKCGFKINGTLRTSPETATVEFIAVEVETEVAEFCSLWKDYTICVCPFRSCNSMSGTLFESLLKSMYNEGRVKGENNTIVVTNTHERESELKKIINSVSGAHKGKILDDREFESVMNNATLLEEFKRNNSGSFPNEVKKQKLIRQGSAVVRPATQVVVTTETQPSDSDSSLILPIVIGVVVLLVVGVLVLAAVYFLVCRKKKNKMNTDSRGEDSKENVSPHQKPKEVVEVPEKKSAEPKKKEDVIMEPTIRVSLRLDTSDGTGTSQGTTATAGTTGGSAMLTTK